MARILLIGTDPTLRDMYVEVLSNSGFDPVCEETARDGLGRLGEEFFPACIVFLTREETLWLLIKIRGSHNVKISTIPILVVVDEASENLSEFIEMGATRALVRFPASGDLLVTQLRSIVNLPRLGP